MTHVITARNVNEAFMNALWWIRVAGKTEDSRNGPVLVAPGPVITEYLHPVERVLFNPKRDANPVFHLMEALWMIAGDSKLDFVVQFNARMAEYGENGIQWGAYGKRWASYFGKNQITGVINELGKNPGSRRAVIGMWDPCLDLTHGGVDVPCLSGDTTLKSPEGSVSLKELTERFERKEISRWPVYSYDVETRKYCLSWCTRVWKSGCKKTIKITFLDGTILRCTHDHVVYIRFHSQGDIIPVQAGTLRPGYKMFSHPFWASRDWEVLSNGVGTSTYEPVHELYADLLGWNREGLDIHHKDNNPRNNSKSNLELMTRGEHTTHHLAGVPTRSKKKREIIDEGPSYSNGDSHIVTSVEEWGEEDVYDFTVPETHTALVNSGVVVHNCNTHIYFDLRGGDLNMTVCCRSNDLLWGAYGANVVHFSVLQEVIAYELMAPVGVYRQFSNNFHIYTDLPMARDFLDNPPHEDYDLYAQGLVEVMPILSKSESYEDLRMDCCRLIDGGNDMSTNFMNEVAVPLRNSYLRRKAGAEEFNLPSGKTDWFVAYREWVDRRTER